MTGVVTMISFVHAVPMNLWCPPEGRLWWRLTYPSQFLKARMVALVSHPTSQCFALLSLDCLACCRGEISACYCVEVKSCHNSWCVVFLPNKHHYKFSWGSWLTVWLATRSESCAVFHTQWWFQLNYMNWCLVTVKQVNPSIMLIIIPDVLCFFLANDIISFYEVSRWPCNLQPDHRGVQSSTASDDFSWITWIGACYWEASKNPSIVHIIIPDV